MLWLDATMVEDGDAIFMALGTKLQVIFCPQDTRRAKVNLNFSLP
jgi:hypothetical protein